MYISVHFWIFQVGLENSPTNQPNSIRYIYIFLTFVFCPIDIHLCDFFSPNKRSVERVKSSWWSMCTTVHIHLGSFTSTLPTKVNSKYSWCSLVFRGRSSWHDRKVVHSTTFLPSSDTNNIDVIWGCFYPHCCKGSSLNHAASHGVRPGWGGGLPNDHFTL